MVLSDTCDAFPNQPEWCRGYGGELPFILDFIMGRVCDFHFFSLFHLYLEPPPPPLIFMLKSAFICIFHSAYVYIS